LFRYDLHIMLYALERKEGKPGELEWLINKRHCKMTNDHYDSNTWHMRKWADLWASRQWKF
jgi:hypothetical protein